MNGVLEAFDGAGVVEVRAHAVGDGDIGLLNVGEHLGVEGIGEWLLGRGDGGGIGVFGGEMGEGLGGFFAEPGVVVGEGVAVEGGGVWLAAGDGWLGRCGRGHTVRINERGARGFTGEG